MGSQDGSPYTASLSTLVAQPRQTHLLKLLGSCNFTDLPYDPDAIIDTALNTQFLEAKRKEETDKSSYLHVTNTCTSQLTAGRQPFPRQTSLDYSFLNVKLNNRGWHCGRAGRCETLNL